MEIFKEDIPEGERMGEYEIEGFHVNVKEFLDKMFTIIKKIKPSSSEVRMNPRSRSAKVNVLEKK